MPFWDSALFDNISAIFVCVWGQLWPFQAPICTTFWIFPSASKNILSELNFQSSSKQILNSKFIFTTVKYEFRYNGKLQRNTSSYYWYHCLVLIVWASLNICFFTISLCFSWVLMFSWWSNCEQYALQKISSWLRSQHKELLSCTKVNTKCIWIKQTQEKITERNTSMPCFTDF